MRVRRLDRREFVGSSLLAAAGIAWGEAASAAVLRSGHGRPILSLCDQRYALFRDRLVSPGQVTYLPGDLTALWRDTLSPLWKGRAAMVEGITTAPALLCLEQLARGERHVVAHRQALGVQGALYWLITPVNAQGRA